MQSTVLVLIAAALAAGRCTCVAGGAAPFRLPRSPYPAPSRGPNCSSTLVAYSGALQPSQLLLMSSLQGLAARTCPLFFRVEDGSASDMQSLFASDFPAFGAHVDAAFAHNFSALLLAAQGFGIARAYALCDLRVQDSCPAAVSFCAASDAGAIVVDVDDEEEVQQRVRIPRVFDARGSTVADVVKTYPLQPGAPWSCSVAVLQDPAKLPYLADVAVFSRAV